MNLVLYYGRQAPFLIKRQKAVRRQDCTRELHFIKTHKHSKLCTKRRQSSTANLLTGKEKHTFLTEHHGIHTDKLVISSIGRLFKFYIFLYDRSIFGNIILFVYHTNLQKMGENPSMGRVTPVGDFFLSLGCVEALILSIHTLLKFHNLCHYLQIIVIFLIIVIIINTLD